MGGGKGGREGEEEGGAVPGEVVALHDFFSELITVSYIT